jgi:hypothetical protein
VSSTETFLRWYEPRRRPIEIGFWIALFSVQALANSVTSWLDIQRGGKPFALWEPVTWEWSSNLVMLALVPLIIAFERRRPLNLEQVRGNWPFHVAFSVIICVVHVVLMVSVRTIVYAALGRTYSFGNWPRELIYEYLKDARGYASIVGGVVFYRLVMRRLQGEASLLSEPDVGAPVAPVARPERFLVKKLGKEFLLPANEIEWAQSWANYVNLHVRGRDHPLRSTLSALQSRLDPERFVRVHRSYIVNLGFIAAIEPQDSGDAQLLLHSGQRVPCSRTYRESLRRALEHDSVDVPP